MAELKIILQGLIQNDDYETVVNELLRTPAMDGFLFSLAFARENGVERIKDNLRSVADKSKVFIGIRNGITSAQSIFSLLKIGIKPYVVDTASNKMFHPKIYAAYSETRAFVILGSANLTFDGLNRNIEASSFIELDRSRQSDDDYIQKLVTTITQLPEKYPDHVFQIITRKQVDELLHEGRLEDERLTRLPITYKTHDNKVRDRLKPIPTFKKRKPSQNRVTKIRTEKIAEKPKPRLDFWQTLLEKSRKKTNLHASISPDNINRISVRYRRGLDLNYAINSKAGQVELIIYREGGSKNENKKRFDKFHSKRSEIEKDFGGKLNWQRRDDHISCKISKQFESAGLYDVDKRDKLQDDMIDAMIRLEKALRKHIDELKP